MREVEGGDYLVVFGVGSGDDLVDLVLRHSLNRLHCCFYQERDIEILGIHFMRLQSGAVNSRSLYPSETT